MEQMISDPKWIPGHSMVLAGYVALLAGFVMLRRSRVAHATRPWLRFATVVTAAQVVEMGFHTLAYADYENLVTDLPTPLLSTHYMLAVVCYPLFAIGIIGLIAAGARDRSLGSWWISWLGIIGAAAQGLAAPLVILGGDTRWAVLFAGILPLGVWVLLAAAWPVRERATAPAASSRQAPVHATAGR